MLCRGAILDRSYSISWYHVIIYNTVMYSLYEHNLAYTTVLGVGEQLIRTLLYNN
jgi:hypothetical protein